MALSRRSFVGGMLAAPAVAAGCAPMTVRPAGSGPSREPDVDVRPLDEYLSGRAAAGQFSGAVLVAQGNRTRLARAYGMADRARGVRNGIGTRFDICSMGKMFTAVAIAQLVAGGHLSFHDTIARYVSGYGFPDRVANTVTIDQLLTHTSGMGDVLNRDGTGLPPTTIAGMMNLIAVRPLLFAPGTTMSYSNSGFIVLGAIIERISGQDYRDHMRRYVFRPAGMTDTDIRVYRPADVPGMAHGYTGTSQDNSGAIEIGNPSGGAISTVTDMLRFARAVLDHRLLNPTLTDLVLAGKVPASGPGRPPEDKYAYGFDDTRVNGVRIVGHNGGSPGYEGELDMYLDKGYVVVILTNRDQALRPAIQRSRYLLTR